MRGIRHFLRNVTASAVREHLRSEIEATGGSPELTKNEIEPVRFRAMFGDVLLASDCNSELPSSE